MCLKSNQWMQEHSHTPSYLLSTASQPLVFCLLNFGHSPSKRESTRDAVNSEMLQKSKHISGLFYAVVELVLSGDPSILLVPSPLMFCFWLWLNLLHSLLADSPFSGGRPCPSGPLGPHAWGRISRKRLKRIWKETEVIFHELTLIQW